MATRNIVPRANGEGGIGTAAKHWGAGHFDTLPNWQEYLAESTGFGIISGCDPTISGLTVTVGAGVVHLTDGTRKEISTSTVTLDNADPSNPRIDLVYITSVGDVAKITGTAAANPSAPTLPSGGISVAQVSVAAGATTGTLTAKRDILPRFYNTGIVNVKDFGAVGDGVTDDTAAIQAALNSNGRIIILNGDYYAPLLNVARSNVSIIINGTLTTEMALNGDNIDVTINGKIKGLLRTATLTSAANQGDTTLVFANGHPFKVGDKISTSYGLGGDGSTPVTVTAVTSTSVTVDTATMSSLPVGAVVGNYAWSSTLSVSGSDIVIDGGTIEYARGYALVINNSNKCVINNLKIQNNGLDEVYIYNSQVKFNNANFNNILDCAKTCMFLKHSDIYINQCYVEINNSDDIFIIDDNGEIKKSNLYINGCIVNTTNNHPYPYNHVIYDFIKIDAHNTTNIAENISVNNVKIVGHVLNGVISDGENHTYVVNNIYLSAVDAPTIIGNLSHGTVDNFQIKNSKFYNEPDSDRYMYLGQTLPVVDGCIFDNCGNLSVIKEMFNTTIKNSTLKFIVIDELIYKNITMINSTITHLYQGENYNYSVDDLLFGNEILQTQYYNNGYVTNIINFSKPASVIKFKTPNSSAEHTAYKNNGHTNYYSKYFKSIYDEPVFGRYDYVPQPDSKVIVVPSESTLTLTATGYTVINSVSGTTVNVNDATNITTDHWINILRSDNNVDTRKVVGVSGNTLTINRDLGGAAKTNAVCGYYKYS